SADKPVWGTETGGRMKGKRASRARGGGGGLGGRGVTPRGEPAKAADEIRRTVGEYGFQGVCMPTSAAGKPLDLPIFADVWGTLAELGLLVFMHATTAITRETLGEYTLNTVIAWRAPSRAAVGVVPRRGNASLSRGASRSGLSRTQARGEPRLSGEHHQAAKSLSLPDLLRHGRSKPGFATLFDRPCWRRSRHVRYRLSLRDRRYGRGDRAAVASAIAVGSTRKNPRTKCARCSGTRPLWLSDPSFRT